MSPQLLILAKAPVPGMAKTRLAPALGFEGAARVARALLQRTEQLAETARQQHIVASVHWALTPAPDHPAWTDWRLSPAFDQGHGTLGDRLNHAFQALNDGPLLVIGTDCPALTPAHLSAAAQALKTQDAALLPACDGGFVLLGLPLNPTTRTLDWATGITWSTDQVAQQTQDKLTTAGLSLWRGPTLTDLDTPDDWAALTPDWRGALLPGVASCD